MQKEILLIPFLHSSCLLAVLAATTTFNSRTENLSMATENKRNNFRLRLTLYFSHSLLALLLLQQQQQQQHQQAKAGKQNPHTALCFIIPTMTVNLCLTPTHFALPFVYHAMMLFTCVVRSNSFCSLKNLMCVFVRVSIATKLETASRSHQIEKLFLCVCVCVFVCCHEHDFT